MEVLIFSLPPLKLGIIASIPALVLLCFTVWLAMQMPRLGIELSRTSQPVEVLHAWGPSDGRLHPSDLLAGIRLTSGETILLDRHAAIVDPSLIPNQKEAELFLAIGEQLSTAMHQETVTFILSDSQEVTIRPAHRNVIELPFSFWLERFFGLSAFFIGISVWAYRRNQLAPKMIALAGTGFMLFTFAIISTRELSLPANWILYLTLFNRGGTFLFFSAMITLLWHFPKPLHQFPMGKVVFSISALLMAYDTSLLLSGQLYNAPLAVIFPLYILTIVLLITAQWFSTSSRPSERITVKWFLLSVCVGIGIAGLIRSSELLFNQIVFSQTYQMGLLLITFTGFAIGVAHFKMFDLDRWWLKTWLWILGGLLVIAMDIGFAALFSISELEALWPALAISGWLYFPARQWLWVRLFSKEKQSIDSHMPALVRTIAESRNIEELAAGWQKLLYDLFQPMQLSLQTQIRDSVVINHDALSMAVPSPVRNETLLLEYPNQGKRIFNTEDKELANSLLVLFSQAFIAAQARDEGVLQERLRIKQDLHDSLGGKILSIMHHSNEQDTSSLAQHAWRELRDILNAMEGSPERLNDVCATWHEEFRQQVNAASATFEWRQELDESCLSHLLTAQQQLNIKRILREAITNALRHSSASSICCAIQCSYGKLTIEVTNNGVATPLESWIEGRGLVHMKTRAESISAGISWQSKSENSITVALAIMLEGSERVETNSDRRR